MSTELYKIQNDLKIVRHEFADLTMKELMNGPYAIRFKNPDFFPVYFIGVEDKITHYFRSTSRIYFAMITLVDAMKHFQCMHGKDYQIDDMKWKEVKVLLDETMRMVPEKITLINNQPMPDEPEAPDEDGSDEFEELVGNGG